MIRTAGLLLSAEAEVEVGSVGSDIVVSGWAGGKRWVSAIDIGGDEYSMVVMGGVVSKAHRWNKIQQEDSKKVRDSSAEQVPML